MTMIVSYVSKKVRKIYAPLVAEVDPTEAWKLMCRYLKPYWHGICIFVIDFYSGEG
jgi:hypothetical protein